MPVVLCSYGETWSEDEKVWLYEVMKEAAQMREGNVLQGLQGKFDKMIQEGILQEVTSNPGWFHTGDESARTWDAINKMSDQELPALRQQLGLPRLSRAESATADGVMERALVEYGYSKVEDGEPGNLGLTEMWEARIGQQPKLQNAKAILNRIRGRLKRGNLEYLQLGTCLCAHRLP